MARREETNRGPGGAPLVPCLLLLIFLALAAAIVFNFFFFGEGS